MGSQSGRHCSAASQAGSVIVIVIIAMAPAKKKQRVSDADGSKGCLSCT
jgi:hypothetical protein